MKLSIDYDSFSLSDQKLISKEIKKQIKEFKIFCKKKIDDYNKGLKKGYTYNYEILYNRTVMHDTTVKINKTDVIFIFGKHVDEHKLSKSLNIEITDGFFSEGIDITLSNGEYVLSF
jgi:hypothetical protein